MVTWFGFLLSITVLMLISRKNLAIGMFVGALILGFFTMSPKEVGTQFWSAFTDPPTILSALAIGLIPIIGGTLNATGQIDNLVDNVRIGKKAFLAVSPALIGMLPMPGGALLSGPLVKKGGKGVPNRRKAALNVWFRHVLYLVYPLAPSLIVSAGIAKLNIYQVIPYQAILLLFSLILGYIFFLRDIPGKIEYAEKFSWKNLLPPLTVILIAPVLDFSLKFFVHPQELATVIGVAASLALAIIIGRLWGDSLYSIIKSSKPWNFALMMVGIVSFLNVFDASGIPQLIGSFDITAEILCVVIGFLLGFGTGRIVTPAGIIIPIFLAKFGSISPIVFAITYFSIFLGYALSPVHPCVSLTVEFFQTDVKDFFKATTPPALIALAVSFLLMITVGV
jgi:integral membrane protein (TIGR00529 family)